MCINTAKTPKTLEERKVEALEKIAENTGIIAEFLDSNSIRGIPIWNTG